MINTCGITRTLVPGFIVGVAISTFTRNDAAAWIAAVATIALTALVKRARGTSGSCALPERAAPGDDQRDLENERS